MRQPVPNQSASMSAPARIGPQTADSPSTGPNAPKAAASSDAGKIILITPKPCGIITAPSAPCRIRLAISISGDWANAHATELSVNPAAPSRNIRLRPTMSPSRPPVISMTANASVYPAAIHWIAV